MKWKFAQPTLPAWLDVLLDRPWTKEASLISDQWLKATEQAMEMK